MSAAPSLPTTPRFTRKSSEESICMDCYCTIRAAPGEEIKLAEQRHLNECSGIPGKR